LRNPREQSERGGQSRYRQRTLFQPYGLAGEVFWTASGLFRGTVLGGIARDVTSAVQQRRPGRAYRVAMTAAQRERSALVETLRTVGPDAPTLCAGWTTRDLAAHLVVRERRLDATPGITIPFLAGYTARVQNQTAQTTSWEDLVDMVASGPPVYSPFKLLDSVANLGEMFIHHEDVRRAVDGWQPRVLDESTVTALGRQLGLLSRMTLTKQPAPIVLRTTDGRQIARVGRGDAVTVTGQPQELVLFVAGRDAVQVEFDGDPQAVAAVRAARRGL
jgi:uncharacterized protein (TIGR03085 family)